MKLAICGSRTLDNTHSLIRGLMLMLPLNNVKEIVSGGCPSGVDFGTKQFAECDYWNDYSVLDYQLIYTEFPADWNTHGKAAGPIRNKQMAEYSDILLLIWDGKSKGSANMKKEMEKLGKPVYEVIIKAPKQKNLSAEL